jgi:hypothetical protein
MALRGLRAERVPADLHHRVVASAGGRGAAAGRASRWTRWAGVAAAAAAVVAIALALPDLGEDATPAETEAAGAQDAADAGQEGLAAPSPGGVTLEVQDRDYDADSLQRLARDPAATTAQTVSAEGAMRGSPEALRCITQAFEAQPTGRLTRLIEADFQGRRAYIAVYLEGRAAGRQADTAVAWVAARDDCTILSVAQARI